MGGRWDWFDPAQAEGRWFLRYATHRAAHVFHSYTFHLRDE